MMDMFSLRDGIINAYTDYTQSFLTIQDPDISAFVQSELSKGRLLPEALIQLSPSYHMASTVTQLAEKGIVHPHTAAIFHRTYPDGTRVPLPLYHHQQEALSLAAQKQHFVVTTGTGSGKSLTYLIPIVDYIIRNFPETGKVRAILVYPMNALINSQALALERFMSDLPSHIPRIRFARYTGQEAAAEKAQLQQSPPHILLTNYVMLELMLTRPAESPFVNQDQTALQFIVLDELHTYRGRQGADVALLMRRLRERSGNPHVVCIGTSATMVSDPIATSLHRRGLVAKVASNIFGVDVVPEHIIEETLTRSIPNYNDPTDTKLREAVTLPIPETMDWQTYQAHPLAAWVESTYSVQVDPRDPSTLRRADPKTLSEGATRLATITGLSVEPCKDALQQFLHLGSRVRDAGNTPAIALKLHQFMSQGSAVATTLESPEHRSLTMHGQRLLASPSGGADRLLFPLVFCRACGKEYALCTYDPQARQLEPRHPMSRGEEATGIVLAGYLLLGEDSWTTEDALERLPESWKTTTGKAIKKDFRYAVPQRLRVTPDGSVYDPKATLSASIIVWFFPMPFLTCLHCGIVYTRQNRDDFRKLARLSSEGRSTSTTLIAVTTVAAMRQLSDDPTTQKLLSFTDNRQDASLQAGHFNDFALMVRLRGALFQAINQQPKDTPVTYATIAAEVMHALHLPQQAYARDVGTSSQAQARNEQALQRVLEYRIYEDLRRSWRVTQPNLEACGLLQIAYRGLEDICKDDTVWQAHSILHTTPASQRYQTVFTLLEHLRRDLAINAPILDVENQKRMLKEVEAMLKPDSPWTIDEQERKLLRQSVRFVLPDQETAGGRSKANFHERSFSPRTMLGRYLRSSRSWAIAADLDEDAYIALLHTLLDVLIGEHLLTDVSSQRAPRAVQLRHDALLWCRGTGTPPPPDPIRTRWQPGVTPVQPQANTYFQQLYQQPDQHLWTMEGREHTGQTSQEDRELREQEFRAGNLPVLFCSPTMELGIDIADLNVVHMRNVPPTPANYAQRSGRAGRSGQPALVMTYASAGSGHDQYFFQRPKQMVMGVVTPPQIDLDNEDLIRAHIHAIWLTTTALALGHSLLTIIDASQPHLPLHTEVLRQITLDDAGQAACLETCQRVLAESPTVQAATWYSEQWLEYQIAQAPTSFDAACQRWRDMYLAADQQVQASRRIIDRSHQQTMQREEVQDAKRREQEALRQKDLLCNTTSGGHYGDTDFSPYRYFASEGFLPGYNFPRLPVRAFLPQGSGEGVFLARPRFLSLREFGPQNIIYHEGRKYKVVRTLMPAGGSQQRWLKAKLCYTCGAFSQNTDLDLCDHCGTRFSTDTSSTLDSLFEMTTVFTQPVFRITCEEEERQREGYQITTHFQFARESGSVRSINAEVTLDAGEASPPLDGIAMSYGQAATIWRINHGWNRARQPGFVLDLQTGTWERSSSDAPEDQRERQHPVNPATRIVVRDTRNVLLVALTPPLGETLSPEQLISLQYALQRGMLQVYQLEEQELSVERVGEGRVPRLLFWETSEGGAGVLHHLAEDATALARVARAALEMCHFDPDSGEDQADVQGKDCSHACYHCLLSYANQPDHKRINRFAVRDVLLSLLTATVMVQQDSPVSPPAISLDVVQLGEQAKRVFAHLESSKRRMPDAVAADMGGCLVPFFYAPSYCILCPDRADDPSIAACRDDLEARGYTVVVISPDQELEPQLARYAFLQHAL